MKRPPADARGAARGGRGLLPDLHPRPARPHRQHRRRRGRAAAAASCATTATTPISSSPPTRAPPRSPTSPTRSRVEYGFWLGDAFASGGSTGYDHKKMGITARGAWESVQAPLPRARASTSRREDFTVVGIGDMSGDVFGNGMLLSRAHPAGRRVRPPPRLPRPGSRPRARASRSASGCSSCRARRWDDYDRDAHLGGRRRVPAHGEVDRALAARRARRSASSAETLTPNELIQRAAARARRPALERRHRHLREGERRDARRRRRQGQRRACASNGAELRCAGGRRGRQPRLHAARRGSSTRSAGGRDQHRRDRQLRRRRLLRPRGEHQDPARRGRRGRRPDARSSATSCSRR